MGKSQRTKGAVYEREVAAVFSEALGQKFERNIGQARDSGNDIDIGQALYIEAKRRKRLDTLTSWYEQAVSAVVLKRAPDTIPAVVMRADNARSFVLIDLDDFITLTKPELLRRLSK